MNFDEKIDRSNTGSLKWDLFKDKDVIPMWVADMDFRSPQPLIDSLLKRVEHGIFGYTLPSDSLLNSIVKMLNDEYDWRIEKEWIVFTPGIVSALNICCRVTDKIRNEILVPSPVYPPFFEAPELSGRIRKNFNLSEKNGRLVIDENLLLNSVTEKTAMLLLCNPHNPGGTVFSREELSKISEICLSRGIMICSDEIHCGLVLDKDKKHIPIASLSKESEDNTITLMAPSKTFNIPGLGCSFAVIPNSEIKRKFLSVSHGIVPYVNLIGLEAAKSAFSECRKWHEDMLNYLRQNRKIAFDRINSMKNLRMLWPEATYLAWIDTKKTGLKEPAKFFEDHGVGLSDGKSFGAEGFLRLNFACRKSLLEKALNKIEAALEYTS